MKGVLPLVPMVLAAVVFGVQFRPAAMPDDQMDLPSFGSIPVVYNGRVKPIDTFARNQLRSISEGETFVDDAGKRRPAVRWAIDVMVDSFGESSRARKHRVFRIVDQQVRNTLKLPEREGMRYSIEEFGDRLPELMTGMKAAHEKQDKEQALDGYDRELLRLERRLGIFQAMSGFAVPHLIPPRADVSTWRTLSETFRGTAGAEPRDPSAGAWVKMLEAYHLGQVDSFNTQVAEYRGAVDGLQVPGAGRSGMEALFNRVDPFNLCKYFYLLAGVLTCVSWLGWTRPVNRSAFWLLVLVAVVHTLALATRVVLSGRAPVTNLYSSAIFIGWAVVIFGLVIEAIFKLSVGNLVASIAGFGTLLIAYVLSADGDTMEVLQAVLDTNFWLWTHVTCITLGYAATFLAGLIGMIFVLWGVPARTLTAEARTLLARMVYGAVCFAMFFSFVGTVLGGLWADDSWGRFWGWDPKENGALMIVIWNALILHARWGGLVRERGLAVLAVGGNIVTSWSWFGVNELGVGLHSYGFTEGRASTLVMFILSQAAVMGLGMMPRSFWRSPEAVREPKPGDEAAE